MGIISLGGSSCSIAWTGLDGHEMFCTLCTPLYVCMYVGILWKKAGEAMGCFRFERKEWIGFVPFGSV